MKWEILRRGQTVQRPVTESHTPLGLSPAQKLFRRPMQDILPAHSRSFSYEWQHSAEEIEHKVITTAENHELLQQSCISPFRYQAGSITKSQGKTLGHV